MRFNKQLEIESLSKRFVKIPKQVQKFIMNFESFFNKIPIRIISYIDTFYDDDDDDDDDEDDDRYNELI
jgi:hypothetical protein